MIGLFSDTAATNGIDLMAAVKRVLERHWYVLGQEVTDFEREFAAYVGVSNCVTVANGTDALEIALRGLGVKRGDKVISVANAGFYGSTAIHAIGATPIYVDVDDATLTMAPAALTLALAEKPSCVIVTHLYGQLADMESLLALTRGAGIQLLEDCAQAHGARRNGRRAGSWGDAACFSFYPTKNLGALGDGGAVVMNDEALAARCRSLRQYGWTSKYQVVSAGGKNSRLDEIQAAILREKLPHLESWNTDRRRIAALYNAAFASIPEISTPPTGEDHVAHLYAIRIDERDRFRDFMKAQGVATDVHYPIPDHLQPAYSGAIVAGTLDVTENASARIVSLPCYPGMAASDVAQVIAAVKAFFGR